ncbi:MAG: hypothetical protein GEV08_04745 [Acidimicrobiia bacterium]|nr:hypothetical protein [Acidimicrobiia bacterium]
MSSVLVAGTSASAAALARFLSERGHHVIEVAGGAERPEELDATWAPVGADLVAAFALDVGDDFDADAWTTAVHRISPEAAVAFAWARSGSNGWATQCERWLERTPPLGGTSPDTWAWPQVHRAIELPADARAASAARRLVHALGAGAGPVFEDAVALAVSELATNAATHGQPPIHLDAVASDGVVYVGVEDVGSGQLPRRREAKRFDEAGRGLAIVAAVADWWGVTSHAGRVLVWCILSSS